MHVAVVGDGQAIHAQLLDVRHQLGDPVGPVEQGIFAVGVEMDEDVCYRLWVMGCSRRQTQPIAHSSLIVLWTPARATRHPAGHREPEAAPIDDRGDRPPRTRDGRRPPNLPLPRLRLLPRPLSARLFPPHRPASPPCRSPWAAPPRAERWFWPADSAGVRPDLPALPLTAPRPRVPRR